MAIPKYDEMYREFLDCLADMQPHTIQEIRDSIARSMSVSDAERHTILPSGQNVFVNRISWTCTYLKKAGLITSSRRSTYQLTQLGKQVLNSNPNAIDNSFLGQFKSFQKFIYEGSTSTNHNNTYIPNGQTPENIIDILYKQINHSLADNLLSEITKRNNSFFTKLVFQLLENMGYRSPLKNVELIIGQAEENGKIGIVQEDELGFSLIHIQAIRQERTTPIGKPEIQKFVDTLVEKKASKGLFITTAQFSKEALEYAQMQHTTKIVLIDGKSLAQLMIKYNVGVSIQAIYQIKQLDKNFFNEDNG